ncbi:MAG: PHP domain-containing protein [Bacteroidota bacterium]
MAERFQDKYQVSSTRLQRLKADLHIHTVLSPCADLEMTPANIVKKAKEEGLNIIGITDHNSTKNALLVKRLAVKEGIFVLTGAEVTTKEEVHCLAFFEHEYQLAEFQEYLEKNIERIPNPDGHFGYQPVVDENDNILELVPYLLSVALKKGITEIQEFVYSLNGIFIPAHITRSINGIFSQLGFIPVNLKFDALGITRGIPASHVRKQYNLKDEISFIYNSDAHFLDQMGKNYSFLNIESAGFFEIKMALNQLDRRFIEVI